MTATLVYDGDCGFCTASVRWVARLGLRADVVVPWQEADLAALGLTRTQCEAAVQWVDGARSASGSEAVARLLLASRLPWKLLGGVLLVPPVSWLAAAVYAWVAAHRGSMPGSTPACALPPEERPRAS